ncbi:hypothetical protein HK103_003567 [Boothiomyces macroporosus]|uniref:Wax synthase domain-containing protein n=1 Tax=Boothiomyces macroporosus TaxID=261099 RepID=A0AAD5UI65_9FUNG|nr:hypothetical protein HK103_003567 [Boothiomyces macroporosus]
MDYLSQDTQDLIYIATYILQNPVIMFSMPGLHYLLLQSNLSDKLATFPVLALIFILPLIRFDPCSVIHFMYAFSAVFMFLRISDIYFVNRKFVKLWEWRDYMEYFFTYDLSAIKEKKEEKEKKELHKRTVAYKDQNQDYFVRVGMITALKGIVLYLILRYIKYGRPDWMPLPYEMVHFKDMGLVMDQYLLSLALCIMLDLGVSISMHWWSFFFRIPYAPVMNQPYFSTSIRDFWANRWNLHVGLCLRRICFEPVVAYFGYKPNQKIPPTVLMIGAFSTFVYSALMHEWLLFAMTDNWSYGEHFMFFTLHGVISTLEVVIRKFIIKTFGIDLAKVVPKPLQIIYANTVLMLLAPLFLNPYIRDRVYLKYVDQFI